MTDRLPDLLFVFDASGFLAIESEAQETMRIFDTLGELVEQGRITYCDEVVDELNRMAGDTYVVRWARSLKKVRCDVGGGYDYYQRVIDDARDLVDVGVPGESAPVQVLAQALRLRDSGEAAVVVTDDVIDKPTRIALVTACVRLEVEWVMPRACLANLGIEELLV